MPPPKSATRAGYVLFAVGTFLLSLYWTFPAQVITMRVAQEVAKATGGQVRIKVGRADLWRVTGVAAHDIKLQMGDGAPVQIDAARVRLRLLPLLLARGSVYGQVQLGQGLAEIVLSLAADHDADIKLDAIDLMHPPWLAKQLGMPVQGVVSGTASLTGLPAWRQLKGTAQVQMDKVSFGPSTVQGMTLPQVGLGQLSASFDMGDGQAKISQFRQTGGNINLDARGKIMLAEPLDNAGLDMCGKIRVEPEFLKANPKLAAVLQLAEVQLKRDASGFLNIPLTGTMRVPQLRPGLCPNR